MKSILFHLLLVIIVLVVFNNTMELTAFSPIRKKEPPFTKHFLQQGWKFFTKDPRENLLKLYAISNNNTIENKIPSNNSPKNYLGLNRKSRKLGAELSVLKDLIPKKEWVDQKDLKGQYESMSFTEISKNKYIQVLPSGIYLLIESEVVPWKWIRTLDDNSIPSKVVKIKLND